MLPFFELTKLMLFAAAHFSSAYDWEGNHFFKDLPNNRLHGSLTAAVNVFENWANNYHLFIKDWHKSVKRSYLRREPLRLWDSEFYFETYNYEIFNYVLHECFSGKQYAFLRREFENFIEKFIAGDFPDQPALFDNLD
jgi:hypothetical protein